MENLPPLNDSASPMMGKVPGNFGIVFAHLYKCLLEYKNFPYNISNDEIKNNNKMDNLIRSVLARRRN